MNNKQTERRFVAQEFRVSKESESAKIGGYASVFNSRAELPWGWTEEVDPHAFDGVLASNPDVRALFNHNVDNVLGRTAAGTLRLSVDDHGLAYEVDPPDTTLARDLMTSMRRGDVTQSSFGFTVTRDEWTEDKTGVNRKILEIGELLDVSPVTYPAYPTASSGVRSLPETMPAEYRSRFESRDDADTVQPNANGCVCDCTECVAGECQSCTDPDCTDESCLANRAMHDSLQVAILPIL